MKQDRELDIYFYIAGWILTAVGLCALLLLRAAQIPLFAAAAPCFFHAATGYYCPGCGGTRAVYALLTGHPLRSFRCHPAVLYAALVGGYFMVSQTVWRLSRHRLSVAMHYRAVYLWGMLVVIALNFAVKNAALLLWSVDLLAG